MLLLWARDMQIDLEINVKDWSYECPLDHWVHTGTIESVELIVELQLPDMNINQRINRWNGLTRMNHLCPHMMYEFH